MHTKCQINIISKKKEEKNISKYYITHDIQQKI